MPPRPGAMTRQRSRSAKAESAEALIEPPKLDANLDPLLPEEVGMLTPISTPATPVEGPRSSRRSSLGTTTPAPYSMELEHGLEDSLFHVDEKSLFMLGVESTHSTIADASTANSSTSAPVDPMDWVDDVVLGPEKEPYVDDVVPPPEQSWATANSIFTESETGYYYPFSNSF